VVLALSIAAIGFAIETTPAAQRWNGDLRLYHDYAAAVLRGQLDDTDYLRQYPPLALVPLLVPQIIGLGALSFPLYAALYTLLTACAAGAGLALLRRTVAGAGQLAVPPATALYAGLCLLATVVIVARFDVWPMLAVLAAMAAMSADTALVAGAALGIGFALKLYPAVLQPVVVAWFLYRGRRRCALLALLGFLAAAVLGLAPYLLVLQGAPAFVAFQLHRPMQIETLVGSLVAFAGSAGITPVQIVFGSGSFNLAGPAVDALDPWIGAFQLVVVGLGYAAAIAGMRAGRGVPRLETAWRGMLIVLLAVLLSSRVFSAQYLVWLIPLLAATMRRRWELAAAVVVLGLTAVLFPFAYEALIALQPLPVALLVARNVVLACLFAWLVVASFLGPVGRPDHHRLEVVSTPAET